MILNFSMTDWVLGFMSPGPMELAIIAGIVLVLFGGAKLPQLVRNLGRSTNEFKRGMNETLEEDEPAREEKA